MLLPTQYNCLMEHPLCGVPMSVMYNTFYSSPPPPPSVATYWFRMLCVVYSARMCIAFLLCLLVQLFWLIYYHKIM